jgi:hypothetical protein
MRLALQAARRIAAVERQGGTENSDDKPDTDNSKWQGSKVDSHGVFDRARKTKRGSANWRGRRMRLAHSGHGHELIAGVKAQLNMKVAAVLVGLLLGLLYLDEVKYQGYYFRAATTFSHQIAARFAMQDQRPKMLAADGGTVWKS